MKKKNILLILGIAAVMLSISGCEKAGSGELITDIKEYDSQVVDIEPTGSTDGSSDVSGETPATEVTISEGEDGGALAAEYDDMLIGTWNYSGITTDTGSDIAYDGSMISISIMEGNSFMASYENAEFYYSYSGTWKTFMQGDNACIEFAVSNTDDEAVMLQNTLGGFVLEQSEDDNNTIKLIQISNGGSIFAEYFGDYEPVIVKAE